MRGRAVRDWAEIESHSLAAWWGNRVHDLARWSWRKHLLRETNGDQGRERRLPGGLSLCVRGMANGPLISVGG